MLGILKRTNRTIDREINDRFSNARHVRPNVIQILTNIPKRKTIFYQFVCIAYDMRINHVMFVIV